MHTVEVVVSLIAVGLGAASALCWSVYTSAVVWVETARPDRRDSDRDIVFGHDPRA